MTAFTTSQIPSSVDTLEKLAVWAITGLQYMYPTAVSEEGEGFVEKAVTSNSYYIQSANRHAFLGRVSLGLSPDRVVGGAKHWTYALNLGTDPLPVIFTTN
ncbi:MAG: glucose-6-phosphate dehydrogenase [Cyanobacteria bacterium]|nr:glucose-6-phosphate dehydrogenase [Cyanobacteriota bacterium]